MVVDGTRPNKKHTEMDKYEAIKKANEDKVGTHCIWCREHCERTEVVDTEEAWERWCYCKKCDRECFHLIAMHYSEE